jgi:hypothetical protein
MPKQATHVVRQWCQSLGVLTAISITRQEAEMKLAAYVPLLMDNFPDAAFTSESLNHVARECLKGFPTYPELVNHLGAWWREHRPAPPTLPPPPLPPARPPPTPEEVAHVHELVAQMVATLRSADAEVRPDAPRSAYLSPGLLDELNPLPDGRKRTDAGVLR